jgi:pimeloyl-ACP methyl ester carboxylesterase
MAAKDSRQRPIVLVPGACLGGWAWSEVAPRLRDVGHDVYPVTLTGLGERVHLSGPHVDLETHIADAVNVLDFNMIDDALLVGHSYAGIVITAVADRRAERLSTVVYLDTAPLPDGLAIADVQSPEQRALQQRAVEEDGDGWNWPAPDRDTLIAGTFGSANGLTDEHFRLIAELATPQPYATMTSPLRLGRATPPEVGHAAIFCTAGGIDVAQVRQLVAQGDPRAAMFADRSWELHELPTGHWPMFSSPSALADLIHQIAEPATA